MEDMKVAVELTNDEIQCLICACNMFNNHTEKMIAQFRHINGLNAEMEKTTKISLNLYHKFLVLGREGD